MNVDNPGYYAVIPANIRYDKRLKPNAKLLYGEITCLTNKKGFCWAENAYFADLFEVSNETISRWISQLSDFGYIEVEICKKSGNKRKISLFGFSVKKRGKKQPENDVEFEQENPDLPIDENVNTYCQKNQEVLTKMSRGIDKNVNSYIRMNNKYNNKENNKEISPLAFLQKNSPSLYENLLMKYRSQIKDFDHAINQANLKIESEDLEWTSKKIYARFQYFLNNWKYNENKYSNHAETNTEIVLPQSKKI